MICTPEIGKEVVRGTITRDRWNADVKIGYEEVPLGRLSHISLSVTSKTGEDENLEVILSLRSQAPTAGGKVLFDRQDGPTSRTFSGSTIEPTLVAIYGVKSSAGSEPDVFIDVSIDGELRGSVGLKVQSQTDVETGVDTAVAFQQLNQEMMVATLANRPEPNSLERRIWDRYETIFSAGKAIAAALSDKTLDTFEIPMVSGGTTEVSLEEKKGEIIELLNSHKVPDSISEDKAKGRTDAFDRFQGHWRGAWRQENTCSQFVDTCQDHLWQETTREGQTDTYIQLVQFGPDSRAHQQGAVACSAFGPDIIRDVSTHAINAININTGVITGAVGIRSEGPDSDGIISKRPHVGFYIKQGGLLWVAEEPDVTAQSEETYSIFFELRETEELYTLIGFGLIWNRASNRIVDSSIKYKGGQYLRILTANQRQLEEQFQDKQLQPEHLQQLYYRRQLERLDIDDIRTFQNNAAEGSSELIYLNNLLAFSQQQAVLRAAPVVGRPSVTFIMGDRRGSGARDNFYYAANGYFTLNPAGELVTDKRSLREVRDYIESQATEDVPWGEINIVVHANEEGGLSIPVEVSDAKPDTTPELLEKAITDRRLMPLLDSIIDARTTIRIRGCAIGRSESMLALISRAFGGETSEDLQRPVVRAPIHLQGYWRVSRGGRIAQVEEYLVEFYFVGWAGGLRARPSRAVLVAAFSEKYTDVDINWNNALRNRINGITQATRDRPYEYTYGYRYSASNPPTITRSSSSSDLFDWLIAESNIEADVTEDGSEVSDYSWRVTAGFSGSGDSSRIDLTASGTHTILRLQREVTAQLVQVFELDNTFLADFAHRRLSENLALAFAQNNEPLSKFAQIETFRSGEQWLIIDPAHPLIYRLEQIKTYSILAENGRLKVRKERKPENSENLRRAHPPATDLNHFGEYVPARPALNPIGENVPIPP